jgi:hypothetical protein
VVLGVFGFVDEGHGQGFHGDRGIAGRVGEEFVLAYRYAPVRVPGSRVAGGLR